MNTSLETSGAHEQSHDQSHEHDRLGNIIHAVGNTPLVELKRISEEVAPIRMFAKCEWFNPGGSVKDRPALNMLLDGEKRGALGPGKTILDATSGNTGIAYAMFGAALGYPVKLCLPANAGKLHKRILRTYGAEIIETPAAEASDGAIRGAMALYKESPDKYFYPDQYNNDANWQAHYNGTAVEILEQLKPFDIEKPTHFIAGLGTSGTFTGNTKRLKHEHPEIQAISIQPDTPLHALEGWKHMETSIKPGFYDESLADENRFVKTEDAFAMIPRLASEEGLLVSPSGAAAVAASLQYAQLLKEQGKTDSVIVMVLADNAAKYLDHVPSYA